MANLEQLKNNIMAVIKDNNYDLADLKAALQPVSVYTENSSFTDNIDQIVNIITKDRDGNSKFDVNDLGLMSKDVLAITSLITAILLIIGSIPEFKLQYEEGTTEELVFKLLAYIFLVVIPKQTGNPWSFEEKQSVVELTLLVYQLIKSSQVTKDLIAKIVAWFQTKGWCMCLSKAEKNEAVLEKKLPKVRLNLFFAMNNVRDRSEMEKKIRNMKN